MRTKLVVLFVAIVLAFVCLVGRVTYINAKNGEKYTKIVLDQQQYNSRVIPFKRGDILDRNGTVMATSMRVYNVILDAYVMLAKDDKEDKQAIAEVKEVLEECFEIDRDAIDEIVDKKASSRYNILKKKVSYKQAQKFQEYLDDKENYPYISCVWLEQDYIRKYPYNTLASDVIGFTVAGNVGNAGIESSYNDVLNGTNGREYGYLDTDSSLERTVKNAVNGQNVVTTIDVTLQSIVEKHIMSDFCFSVGEFFLFSVHVGLHSRKTQYCGCQCKNCKFFHYFTSKVVVVESPVAISVSLAVHFPALSV